MCGCVLWLSVAVGFGRKETGTGRTHGRCPSAKVFVGWDDEERAGSWIGMRFLWQFGDRGSSGEVGQR